MTNREPYDVGYKKPPTSTRFQKGKSGNPKGRPKGSLSLATLFNRALSEKVTIIENGRKRAVSKLEAALKGLVNRSAQGDGNAIRLLMSMSHLIGVEDTSQATVLPETDREIMSSLMKRMNPRARQGKRHDTPQ